MGIIAKVVNVVGSVRTGYVPPAPIGDEFKITVDTSQVLTIDGRSNGTYEVLSYTTINDGADAKIELQTDNLYEGDIISFNGTDYTVISVETGDFGFPAGIISGLMDPAPDPVMNPGVTVDVTVVLESTAANQYRFLGVGTYSIDWGDGGGFQTVTDAAVGVGVVKSYATPGIYQIKVKNWADAGSGISFCTSGDRLKLSSIDQWGAAVWTTFENAFSGCVNMIGTFTDSPNLTSCTSMSGMFAGAILFNSNIGSWNVSSVTNMSLMFNNAAAFNHDISSWNVSKVTNMSAMFAGADSFDQPLTNWERVGSTVGNVTIMNSMFSGANVFNSDISGWNVSKVTNMSNMFNAASAFNQDISSWDVSKVTSMNGMFQSAVIFNQDISGWDVSEVLNMGSMFANANAFNQDISTWNVSKVTNMSVMFASADSFNQPLANWQRTTLGNTSTVGNVTLMNSMFNNAAAFNQDISSWNVSSVTNMSYMFNNADSFNQPLANWERTTLGNTSTVGNVTNMIYMFNSTNMFNQSLGTWILNNSVSMSSMLDNCGMSAENYSKTLIGWANEAYSSGAPTGRTLGASGRSYNSTAYDGSPYNAAGGINTGGPAGARAYLVGTKGWTITGDTAV